MSAITVKDIVRAYLEAKGFDGLYNSDLECGCRVNDLEPCGDMMSECEPGRQRTLTQADIDSGRYDQTLVWAGCWVIEPVQGLSGDDTVKPELFHGEQTQGSDS